MSDQFPLQRIHVQVKQDRPLQTKGSGTLKGRTSRLELASSEWHCPVVRFRQLKNEEGLSTRLYVSRLRRVSVVGIGIRPLRAGLRCFALRARESAGEGLFFYSDLCPSCYGSCWYCSSLTCSSQSTTSPSNFS